MRLGALAVGATLALAACTGSSPQGSSGGPSTAPAGASSAATGAAPDIDPQVAALLALTPVQLEAELAALTATVERDLMRESGLEAELGGAAAADTAFAAMTAAIIERATSVRDSPSFGRFGGRVPAEDEMSLGGLIFGGWLVAGMGVEGVVKASNDFTEGAKPETKKNDSKSGTFDVVGSLENASIDSKIETTIKGVTGTLHVTANIAPCPDVNGVFTTRIAMDASATSAGGRTGSNVSMQIDVTGRVGDDAEMTGYDVSTRTQAADFKASKGAYVDVKSATTWTGKNLTAASRQLVRTGGDVPADMAAQWANMGTITEALVNKYALEAAEKAWKSGRCVRLDVSTSPAQRSGLKPSTTVSVTAAPKSKIDRGSVGGTVTATLNGASSLDPAGSPVPADATYAYVAPSETDKTATVALEARSKRGIGRAEVTFDTKAGKGYFISAASGGTYKTTGLGVGSVVEDGSLVATTSPTDVCDVTVPFTLTNPANGGKQVFTPTSEKGGRTTYTLTFPLMGTSGYVESGKGTYTLETQGGTGRITTKVRGKLTLPGAGISWRTSATQLFDLGPTTTCP